jgi:hypothetical protein
MADPVWTQQYALNQTPEQNGFTRTLYGSPTVNTVTGGTPSSRKVEILSTASDSCVFSTSNVPAINSSVGITAEIIASCTGAGDAGFECTFLDRYVGVQLYSNKITIVISNGQAESVFPTAANTADTTVRFTYSPDGTGRVYRNAVLISAFAIPAETKPFQRVLWWGEGGGTQVFKALRYYLGGPVAP